MTYCTFHAIYRAIRINLVSLIELVSSAAGTENEMEFSNFV